jgi:hypothetical protein
MQNMAAYHASRAVDLPQDSSKTATIGEQKSEK